MSLAVAIDRVCLRTDDGEASLIEDVRFELAAGTTLGIVGESGSGKSILALTLMGLLPPGLRAEGRIELDGADLMTMTATELQRVRGGRIGMIFQEPMTALNPAMRIGDQVAEGLIWHKGLSHRHAQAEALAMLDRVRIPDAKGRYRAYPHEMSGGQRQRVGIAMALAPGPGVILADEPTTALDVTIQADILDLLAELAAERGMAMIIISHDLGVIGSIADRVLVMYGGATVERGATEDVLHRPHHPYTRALLAALPRRPGDGAALHGQRLASIPGQVPRPGDWPPGCRFVTRCARATDHCAEAAPPWQGTEASAARCFYAGEPV